MIIKNGLIHDAVNRDPYIADIRVEDEGSSDSGSIKSSTEKCRTPAFSLSEPEVLRKA